MIPEAHRKHLAEELTEKLGDPVKLVLFTQEVECPHCVQTRTLIQELSSLNQKIKFEVYDLIADSAKTKEYSVDKVPAVAIIGRKDYGLRFYGFPYGYEFKTLIEGLIAASRGATDLPEDIKRELKALTSPVRIQVFVTLTCPYCPAVAATAYKFAVESALVTADVVDVSEFPHLGLKYGVMGVPKTVINDKVEFVGAMPEDIFLEYVLLAAHSQ
ncbi:MAG: thioredoxin family protein [Candidatus Bathyarchaeia archaeon]